MSKKHYLYNGYLQIAELDTMNASETIASVLRKTYLWDPGKKQEEYNDKRRNYY